MHVLDALLDCKISLCVTVFDKSSSCVISAAKAKHRKQIGPAFAGRIIYQRVRDHRTHHSVRICIFNKSSALGAAYMRSFLSKLQVPGGVSRQASDIFLLMFVFCGWFLGLFPYLLFLPMTMFCRSYLHLSSTHTQIYWPALVETTLAVILQDHQNPTTGTWTRFKVHSDITSYGDQDACADFWEFLSACRASCVDNIEADKWVWCWSPSVDHKPNTESSVATSSRYGALQTWGEWGMSWSLD